MNLYYRKQQRDQGPEPYVMDVCREALENINFRETVWTGSRLQLTLMSIPAYGEVGWEQHTDTDQYLRVEQGKAIVRFGSEKNKTDYEKEVSVGDGIFVPALTWHNVVNNGRFPLKLSSVYAPPHHPAGTVHRTKDEAEQDERMK